MVYISSLMTQLEPSSAYEGRGMVLAVQNSSRICVGNMKSRHLWGPELRRIERWQRILCSQPKHCIRSWLRMFTQDIFMIDPIGQLHQGFTSGPKTHIIYRSVRPQMGRLMERNLSSRSTLVCPIRASLPSSVDSKSMMATCSSGWLGISVSML